jgi:hypothetical protein
VVVLVGEVEMEMVGVEGMEEGEVEVVEVTEEVNGILFWK